MGDKITMKTNTNVMINPAELKMDDVVSHESGLFTKVVYNDIMARGEYERFGTRFQIGIMKVYDFYNRLHYVVSLPDSRFSTETQSLHKITHTLAECLNMSDLECESVQMAVLYMGSLISECEKEVLGKIMSSW